ncbi:aldo/keto reductase [Echinicola marina]|uniref:aldo/keto reductase n=1 Tax=Echinicola marina TaxID=2859768 RepID=UPI00293D7E47|nr:aldo/keto reductase [Echinicola marina]UCS93070.1 aldo/keto reductase [Echinicola marina]
MNYRQLGKSSIKISELSFGCMSLKGSKSDDRALLRQAFDQGINYFDTADLYDGGENEKLVGAALKGIRDEVVLATKVGNQLRPDGSGWDWNPRKSYILRAVEKSLQRLQTDYIDLYQLHGGTMDDPIDETIAAFEQLKKEGKIREYGISSIRPNVIRTYAEKSNMVSVMMQYSMLDRRPEEECLGFLAERDISVLVRGAYAKGLSLDKPAQPYLNWSLEEVKNINEKLKTYSASLIEKTELILRYLLNQPAVTSIVSGIRTKEQLQNSLEAFNGSRKWKELAAELKKELPVNRYEAHR